MQPPRPPGEQPPSGRKSRYGGKQDLGRRAVVQLSPLVADPERPRQALGNGTYPPPHPAQAAGDHQHTVASHQEYLLLQRSRGVQGGSSSVQQLSAPAMAHWSASLQQEGSQHPETLKLAQVLFLNAVANQAVQTHPSLTRAGVSCLLLEQISSVFDRYRAVLGTVSETLLRSIYVPDTPEMRDLLGSVDAPIRVTAHHLDGVEQLKREQQQQQQEDGGGPRPGGDGPTLMEEVSGLLAPYGRKTYFMAYEELNQAVRKYAKSNRAIEVRLSRQTKIFEQTVRHWMNSLQRNFFSSWRTYTRRKNTLRDKYKAIFMRIRSDECRVKAMRRWRDHASHMKRTAAVDAASASEMQSLKVSTEQTQEQIAALAQYNNSLGTQIQELEHDRQNLQEEVLEMENQVYDLSQRCQEMERVGTELVDQHLMFEPPPKAATALASLVAWGHSALEDTGGMIDGSDHALTPLLTEEDIVEEVPFAALAAIMLWIGGEHSPTREKVIQIHLHPDDAPAALIEMYERLVGTPSVVTEEQLSSKKRGVFLLFLSGLMRFTSQWLLCKPPAIPRARRVATRSPANSQTWPDRVRIQQQWVTTALNAQHSALEITLRQPVLLSSEEADDLGKFLDLPLSELSDCYAEENKVELHQGLLVSLARVFPEIRKVYYAYASPTVTLLDFTRMMKDCRLIGERKLQKRTIESVARVVWALGPEVGDLSNREVKAHQFVKMLIRLCLQYTRRVGRDNNIDLNAAQVISFFTEHIVPHALHSDVDRFKQGFRHIHVQSVIQKHKVGIRRAFSRYASEESGEALSKTGFLQMARDCKWMQKSVTQDVLADIFKRVQQVDMGNIDTMDLNEFIECVAAVSVYHRPNPFLPLAQKIGPFIEDNILTPLTL